MSSGGIRVSHAAGMHLAEKIVASLRAGCERVEIAGSLRRRKPDVGDIELVIIPRRTEGLYPGQGGDSLLDRHLDNLVTGKRLILANCDGDRQKKFGIASKPGLFLDLFITDAESWGIKFALCTGPADFSKACVTERSRGGRLRDGLVVKDRRVWADGRPLATPEERDFLDVAGGWYESTERHVALPIVDHVMEVARA